jgi:hypothetical protein
VNLTYQTKPSGKAGFEVPCGCDTFGCCCAGGLACLGPGLFSTTAYKRAVLTLGDPGVTRQLGVPHTRICPARPNQPFLGELCRVAATLAACWHAQLTALAAPLAVTHLTQRAPS